MISPHLSRDSQGCVYWKGEHVEHYSYTLEEMADQAEELARRCEHLESIGVPVSKCIWFWPWFETMTAYHWAKPLLLHGNWYESEKGIGYLSGHRPVTPDQDTSNDWRNMATLRYWDGKSWQSFDICSDDLGGHYHPLRAIGWNIPQAGQGVDLGMCYATLEGIETMFKRHGLTKETAQ